MSVRSTSLVWERSRAKGSALMMLLAIADYAKDDGRWAWPSARTLSRKTRLSGRAAELILMALVQCGEIEPRWDVKEKRLYLDVRCICAWDFYQTEGPLPQGEKSSRNQSENFSLRLVQAYLVHAQNGFPKAKKSARTAKSSVGQREKSRAHIRNDPSLDPSVIQRAGADAPVAPGRAVENSPEDSLPVITKLAHEIFELFGLRADVGELTETLKSRCANLRIPYNTDVVRRALDSARWQREHRSSEVH